MGETTLRNTIELFAYALLIIGTLGLLLNEFVFAWGRPATLIFAVSNLIGLLALGYLFWSKRQDN